MLRRDDRTEKARPLHSVEEHSTLAKRSAKLLGQIIFVGLLTLIVLTAIPYGTVDPWFEAVFECAVFALTAVWIFEVLLRGSWQLNKTLILLPMMVLTAYAFFQTVQLPGKFMASAGGSSIVQTSLTIDQYQTYLTAVKMLALTLFTALLLLHVSSRRRLQWLVHVVIGLGLASALFAIGRQMLQSPDSPSGFGLPFLLPGFGYGQFLSPNVFAFLAEMTFALGAGLVMGGGVRRRHVLIYLAATLIIWATLVMSNSRGGILGFMCQAVLLAFVALSWFRSNRLALDLGSKERLSSSLGSSLPVRVLVILAIVAILVAGVFWMGGERLASKFDDRDFANATIDGTTRKEIWHSTWKLIKQNPWTGVGFGAYFLAIPKYHLGAGRIKIEQAHNDYLELAANGGIVAIMLGASFVGCLIWRSRLSLRSSDPFRRAAALGGLAGILSVGVHSLADFGLQISGIAVLALTLVVILIAEIPAEQRLTN
jgi:O-antigen ligase